MLKTLTRLISTIIVTSLISNSVFAAECPNAVYLKVGDTVKDCPRIGLSESYDLEVRKELIEGDYNKKLLTEKDRLLGFKDLQIQYHAQQTDLWRADALRERDAYDKERSRTNTTFWVGLGVGILTVLVAGYAMGQIDK